MTAWSSATRRTDWRTPDWLFDLLHEEFCFTVDAASSDGNAKLRRHWTVVEDGLAQTWARDRVFCNPPYGSGIGAWVEKAHRESGLSVLVVPVRTETHWWNDFALRASEIRFVRGRVHFVPDGSRPRDAGGSRPVFATSVLVFAASIGPRSGPVVSSFATPRIADRLRTLEGHSR